MFTLYVCMDYVWTTAFTLKKKKKKRLFLQQYYINKLQKNGTGLDWIGLDVFVANPSYSVRVSPSSTGARHNS